MAEASVAIATYSVPDKDQILSLYQGSDNSKASQLSERVESLNGVAME